ncbi:MAG TPA: DnaA/Hda family protein, partial [Pirellulales bacterium]
LHPHPALSQRERVPACYSPIVLCGASGSGKSHLADGIGQVRGDAICVTGADFARQLAAAIHNHTVAEFQARYRQAAMLVLEDLSQLERHAAAMLELLHTLDALAEREAPVVITSRVAPSEMSRLPAALKSRLSGGLVLTLASPGPAARREILERLIAARGVAIEPAALELLAENLPGTASELQGALTELELAFADQNSLSRGSQNRRCDERAGVRVPKEKLSSDSPALSPCPLPRGEGSAEASNPIQVEHIRRYLAARQASNRPSLKQIAGVVAKFYGVPVTALSSQSRRRQVALARAVAIYLGRTLAAASLPALGKNFGGRDHTTALHSVRTIKQKLLADAELRGAIGTLQTLLAGLPADGQLDADDCG